MITENSRSAYRDLVVWQKSMDFANSVIDLTEKLETERKHYRLVEQMEAAATSIPMNIADIIPAWGYHPRMGISSPHGDIIPAWGHRTRTFPKGEG
jgi:hypothetical protein